MYMCLCVLDDFLPCAVSWNWPLKPLTLKMGVSSTATKKISCMYTWMLYKMCDSIGKHGIWRKDSSNSSVTWPMLMCKSLLDVSHDVMDMGVSTRSAHIVSYVYYVDYFIKLRVSPRLNLALSTWHLFMPLDGCYHTELESVQCPPCQQ